MFEMHEYEGARFDDLSEGELAATGIAFYDCVFDGCTVPEAKWTGCRFVGCRFSGCDLGLTGFADSSFRETVFEDCRLTGVDWTRVWRDPGLPPEFDFERCILDFGDFSHLDLSSRKLHRCNLHEATFVRSDLREADCRGSDFSRARFSGCDLRGADFREAVNYAIDPTDNRVERARFSLPEALGLLSGLGIELS